MVRDPSLKLSRPTFSGMLENTIEVEGDVAMTATNARAQQTERMGTAPGFIAALDQSGGSTPKALKAYGIEPEVYGDDKGKMFDLVHEMRTRIITSPSFTLSLIHI